MKVAYIAGPYRAPSLSGVYDNIQRAREVAIKYWKRGYAVICPHLNTAFMDGPAFEDAQDFLDGDLELVRRCDVVVMVKGWESSAGATGERQLALDLGKTVFHEV